MENPPVPARGNRNLPAALSGANVILDPVFVPLLSNLAPLGLNGDFVVVKESSARKSRSPAEFSRIHLRNRE